jgi:amino acid permease
MSYHRNDKISFKNVGVFLVLVLVIVAIIAINIISNKYGSEGEEVINEIWITTSILIIALSFLSYIGINKRKYFKN